jgi:hypothetical protein
MVPFHATFHAAYRIVASNQQRPTLAHAHDVN